jgi:hypothetical protein
VLPRSRKEGQPEKRRKVSHEHGSCQSSAPSAPSPLTKAVFNCVDNVPSRYSKPAPSNDDVEMLDVAADKSTKDKKEENKVDELVAKMNAEADKKLAEEKIKANIKANIGDHLKANPKPKRKSDLTDSENDNDNDNSEFTVTNVAAINDNATAGAQIDREQMSSPVSVTESSPPFTTHTPTVTTYTSATTVPADLDAAQLLLGLGRKA